MTVHDYRFDPSAEYAVSFSVLDNMGALGDGQGGDIYRYDTAREAAEMFRYIRDAHPAWRPALGAYAFDTMVGPHEIDLVHTGRDGEPFLVTDYRMDDRWGSGRAIEQAAHEAAGALGLEWQMDWGLLGGPVMVPYAPQERPESPDLANMALRPPDPERPFSSVSSALVEGRGWMSPGELRELSERYEAGGPSCPRVTNLTVSFEDAATGKTGDVPISPHDFKGMEARFQALQQQREAEREAQAAARERASWPNGEPPLPDTGMPFFDYPDGRGGAEKANLAVGVHGGSGSIYVGLDVFDKDLGEMRDGPDFTTNILKLPPFVGAIDDERGRGGVVDFLVGKGFGQLTGDVLQNESRLYPLFRFDEAALEAACPEGVEFYRDRSGLTERRRETERASMGMEPLEELKRQAKERARDRNASCPDAPSPRTQAREI